MEVKGHLITGTGEHISTLIRLCYLTHLFHRAMCVYGIYCLKTHRHLELFLMFLKLFLISVCSVEGCITLLKEATAIKEYSCLKLSLHLCGSSVMADQSMNGPMS